MDAELKWECSCEHGYHHINESNDSLLVVLPSPTLENIVKFLNPVDCLNFQLAAAPSCILEKKLHWLICWKIASTCNCSHIRIITI